MKTVETVSLSLWAISVLLIIVLFILIKKIVKINTIIKAKYRDLKIENLKLQHELYKAHYKIPCNTEEKGNGKQIGSKF